MQASDRYLIRFAARDPGAANNLAVFIRDLKIPDGVGIDVWALSRSEKVFGITDFKPHLFNDDFTEEQLRSEWDKKPADLLITGTSNRKPFEPLLWEIAKENNCPTLAIIDYWTGLEMRFTQCEPDTIGVIDSEQKAELVSLGVDKDKVIITGSLWLADQVRKAETKGKNRASGKKDGVVNFLFLSEAIAKTTELGHSTPYGFTEIDAFKMLYKSCLKASSSNLEIELVVKFHPYEDGDLIKAAYRECEKTEKVKVRFIKNERDPEELIKEADIVGGINTMLMLEAVVQGKPVVSLQPGLLPSCHSVIERIGHAQILTELESGIDVLADLMSSEKSRFELVNKCSSFKDKISVDTQEVIASWIENHRGERKD